MRKSAIIFIFICIIFSKPLFAAEEEWKTVESAYFTIYYKPDCNLKKIERRLRTRYLCIEKDMKLSRPETPPEKIAYRMDILMKKVEEILGMKPRKMRVKVRIFKNRKELNEEYYNMFKNNETPRSFYIYKYNTIYTTERDISDSVMSHEMAHAVLDNYFVMRAPEEIAEILTRHVDLHLDDR